MNAPISNLVEYRAKVKLLVEEFGKATDWEKKNRQIVYKGLLALCDRDFAAASSQFIQSLPTFTPCDILPFKEFIFYTVVATLVSEDRGVLRNKILQSPEILALVREVPGQYELLMAICDCQYSKVFSYLVVVLDAIKADPVVSVHIAFITRSVRLMVYRQFLLAYKSVTISSMAMAFEVTTDFLEHDLSGYIAGGKLHCKIDRIGRLIESNRLEDPRNQVYTNIVKQGDILLNHVQRLSKVIDV